MTDPARPVVRVCLLAAVAVAVVVVSALWGPTPTPPRVLLAGPESAEPAARIFWTLRVPRVLLGAVSGAGLALGGALFQTLLRNPLATPFTLGVASSASLGAATALAVGVEGQWFGLPKLVLFALVAAMLAITAVAALAARWGAADLTRLLLVGVCVAYLASAGVLLVTYLAGRAVTNDIVIWMMGSLEVVRPRAAAEVLCVLLPVTLFALLWRRGFDLLLLGPTLAASRGVATDRLVTTTLLAVGLLVAIIVANCGPVGFVGLIVPHIVRRIVGPRSGPLILGSLLGGAAFLTACDAIARSVSSYALPVGVLTSVAGALFFLTLVIVRPPPDSLAA